MDYAAQVNESEKKVAEEMRALRVGQPEIAQREYAARALWSIAFLLGVIADELHEIHRTML